MSKFIIRIVIYNVMLFVVLFLIVLLPAGRDVYANAYRQKINMLDQIARPRMILVGGSNVAFGFDSKQVEDSLKINVINTGLHAGIGLKFMMDDIVSHLGAGDVVVISAEVDHFFTDLVYGNQPLVDVLAVEPQKISLIEGEQVLAVINNFPAHIKSKLKYLVSETFVKKDLAPYTLSSFNTYGDVVKHWAMPPKNYGQYGELKSEFNDKFFRRFVGQISDLEHRGVRVLMLPANISQSSYNSLEPCLNLLADSLDANGFPYICATQMMAFDDTLFFDTPYHLTKEGVDAKTKCFVSTIRRYLQTDGTL